MGEPPIMAHLALRYPIRTTLSNQHTQYIDKLKKVCDELASIHKASIQVNEYIQDPDAIADSAAQVAAASTVFVSDSNHTNKNTTSTLPSTIANGLSTRLIHQHAVSFSLSGSMNSVMASRAQILRSNPSQNIISLSACRNVLLNANGDLKPVVKEKFEKLMLETNTVITCTGASKDSSIPSSNTTTSSSAATGTNTQPSTTSNTTSNNTSSSTSHHRSSSGAAGDNIPNHEGHVTSHAVSRSKWSANVVQVEISGNEEAAERARIKCLVLLDQLFGMKSTSMKIDPKLIPIISGRKRERFETIMRDTKTTIYQPAAFVPHLVPSVGVEKPVESSSTTSSTVEPDPYPCTIYITGVSQSDLDNARNAILALLEEHRPLLSSFPVPLMQRKIDWFFTDAKKQLRKIAKDNGVYLALPALASSSNIITIHGTDATYIQRAARALMNLATNFYVAFIQLAQIADTPQKYLATLKELQPVISAINKKTGAEIVFQRQFIEIYGTEKSVKTAYSELCKCDIVKNAIRDTKFQVELGLEHHEFINGKKNGKVNRITKLSTCRVVFQENYNEYNMLIDLYSSSPPKALMGLEMLEDELPSEISFHIPEAYHKRIIGVGGKNIQKIMKKYGVYVKFSSAEEYLALGGYYENEDNVIARTPAKNAENLKDLKYTICESVNALDLIESKISLSIARQLFSFSYGSALSTLEGQYNVTITLPDRNFGLDTIEITGDETQVALAKEELQGYSRVVYSFEIPYSSALKTSAESGSFTDVKSSIISEDDTIVSIFLPSSLDTSSSPSSSTSPSRMKNSGAERASSVFDASVFLIHPSLSKQKLDKMKQTILDFFTQNEVQVANVPRSGSYANLQSHAAAYESFQHFNTKLLATVTSKKDAADTQPSSMAPSFSLFSNNSGGPLHTLPHLRSIFDETPSPNIPPGLRRAGSELDPTKVIGRPRNLSLGAHMPATIPSSLGGNSVGGGPLVGSLGSHNMNTLNGAVLTTTPGDNGTGRAMNHGHIDPTEGEDFLRAKPMNRSAITMPDLMSLVDTSPPTSAPLGGSGTHNVASVMNAPIGHVGGGPNNAVGPNGSQRQFSRWGMPLEKSHSATVLFSDVHGKPPLRPSMSFAQSIQPSETVMSPDDQEIEFDANIIDQLVGLDSRNSTDIDKISAVLESIGHNKHLPAFIEHEIDYPTFLTLEDNDLKELGIKALGSRKKILNAIAECRNA